MNSKYNLLLPRKQQLRELVQWKLLLQLLLVVNCAVVTVVACIVLAVQLSDAAIASKIIPQVL